MGPSLDIDYRDNPFLPTEGTFTKLDAEYSAPEIGSSDKIQFVRTQGTFTHYLRMGSPRVVWANSLRGGYGKNLSTEVDSGIPYTFAFFLGGVNTIRGYSGFGNDRIPSEREFAVLDQTDQLIIPKETHYYLIKSEIRFPLVKDPFGAVVFYDAGEVGIQGYTFEQPFKQSAGIGIRINTPVGPLSLDYARKINPLDVEDKDHWHLSIGTF
jgi:outer membrane protein assembly factor BamA